MLRILLIAAMLITIACSSAKGDVVDERLRRCITVLAWVAGQHDHEVRADDLGGFDARAPRLPKYPATAYGRRVSTLPELINEHCAPYIDVDAAIR